MALRVVDCTYQLLFHLLSLSDVPEYSAAELY